MKSKFSGTHILLRTGAAALALFASGQAFADDVAAPETPAADAPAAEGADAQSPEITVTARRRKEAAQDVPVALSVVSEDTLTKTGNFTLTQIQQLVPSFQVLGSNPRNTNINIRGLGANSSIAVDGLEYGVGFYLDGVYYARPGQTQFDLIDLAQVEVLRGPQGTLFGKNTTAGAINVTSKLPSFDPEFVFEGSGGDYGYHQIRISVSGPIIADKVAVRISAADTHRDGFLTNLYDGSDAQNYDNFSVRGQLLAKPVDNVTIRIIGDYSNQHQHFSLSLADGYFTTFANGATIANNIFDRAARTGYTLLPGNAFLRVGKADAPFQANMKSYGVSGQLDWDLGSATLTSITAYRWWDWYPKNDVDGTSLSINVKGQQINFQRQFSQELRLASDGHNTIDYVAGLYYFWQIIRGYGQSAYGPDFAAWNLNPATNTPARIALTNYALNGFEADSFSNPSTKSYAAFGQADWHITPELTLTAGLRFTHEDKVGSFTQTWVAGNDLSLASDPVAAAAIRSQLNPAIAFNAKVSDNALGGLATLSYKPTRDLLLYATYSHGSKSGGLNVTAGGNGRAIIRPEKVDNFEVGIKSQFLDHKVTLNLAGFRTEISDYQTSITEPIAGTTNVIQYISNIPKVRSQGIEGDLVVAPTPWLSFTASGAYTDAKYVTYTNAPQAVERLNVSAIQDLSGVALPGVSKFAYSLGADVTQPAGGGVELYGHADFLHRSSFNSTPTNSIYGVVPAYGVLNARIGIRGGEGRWDLSIWARNLTDTRYYISRTAGNFGLISAIVGDPRTIGGTLRFKL